MAVRLNEENFAQEVLKADKPVLVDFYSDSCIPCKQLSPVLGELEEELGGKIKIAKVNVAFSAELVKKYGVSAVPTIKLFKAGEELQTIKGFVEKNDLKNKIEEFLD